MLGEATEVQDPEPPRRIRSNRAKSERFGCSIPRGTPRDGRVEGRTRRSSRIDDYSVKEEEPRALLGCGIGEEECSN